MLELKFEESETVVSENVIDGGTGGMIVGATWVRVAVINVNSLVTAT